jgi:hypothetical protein
LQQSGIFRTRLSAGCGGETCNVHEKNSKVFSFNHGSSYSGIL